MQHGLKIGITISDVQRSQPNSALWSSGLSQNIVFLALLFQRLETVESVYFVSPDTSDAQIDAHSLGQEFGVADISISDAIHVLDVIIEFGVRISDEFSTLFMNKGGRLVSYMAGNVLIMNMEELSSGLSYGDAVSAHPYDACWITPQHLKTNKDYACLTRTPFVYSAPHIWEPIILEQAMGSGLAQKWGPNNMTDSWKIACFDPNVNFIKTFHFPLLVCEKAYRLEPNLIDHVFLMSADRLIGQTHFEEFVGATNLGRDHKVTAEPRLRVVDVLGTHANAIVTHQWENDLNYLYWDCLYGGFPLIHNSPQCKNVGYYYPDFDPQTGGEVLVRALKNHADSLSDYRSAAHCFLRNFSINNPDILTAYAQLLENLYVDHPQRQRPNI